MVNWFDIDFTWHFVWRMASSAGSLSFIVNNSAAMYCCCLLFASQVSADDGFKEQIKWQSDLGENIDMRVLFNFLLFFDLIDAKKSPLV